MVGKLELVFVFVVCIIMSALTPIIYDYSFKVNSRLKKLEAASTITQQPQERHYLTHADSLLMRNYYLEGLSDGLSKCNRK